MRRGWGWGGESQEVLSIDLASCLPSCLFPVVSKR